MHDLTQGHVKQPSDTHSGANPVIRIDGVSLWYRSSGKAPTHALDRISFDVAKGEFVSIVGPSGSGKSTMLLVVDGLIRSDEGTVTVNGRPVTGPGPDRAVVFQDASLLPWRTIGRNVEYGLELRGRPKAERQAVVAELMRMVGLGGLEHKYPRELSGGMRQRVNVARALATDPEVLLLDEPFAALDAMTREAMQADLLRIWSQSKKTALFITHQIDEAVYLSDRVIVFGRQPARVRADIRIDIERPRSLEVKKNRHFAQYENQIWELIGNEKVH